MSSTWSGCSCGTWKITLEISLYLILLETACISDWRHVTLKLSPLNQRGKQVSNICQFSCHDSGFSEENIHSSSWLSSPEHRGPVTWGGQGRGRAAGPRGGRVVEGGQVGDGRGPGHYRNFYSEKIYLPRKHHDQTYCHLWHHKLINNFCLISYFISANFVLKPAPLLCVWGQVWMNCTLLARWEHLSAAPGPLTTQSIGPASGIIGAGAGVMSPPEPGAARL